MNIGIDICNTLADINLVLKKNLGDWDEKCYIHPAVTSDYFENNLHVFMDAPVIKGALEMVSSLDQSGTIYYITARPFSSRNITIEWLKSNGFPHPERVIHTGCKEIICKGLNIGLMVDDSPFELMALLRAGVNVKKVSKTYNRDVNCPSIILAS